MINLFVYHMSELHVNSMVMQMGETLPKPDSGPAVYLLLINPVVTFIQILSSHVSDVAGTISLSKFLGTQPENFVTSHWIVISLLVQLFLAGAFIKGAVFFLNPVKNEKK